MKNLVLTIIACTLLIGCANRIKEEDRIEQVYPFTSVLIVDYKNSDNSGTVDWTGTIEFTKNNVRISVNTGTEESTDNCSIKTVTYEEDPNDIEYSTSMGDFHVQLQNDTIVAVKHFTGVSMSIFGRSKKM